MAEQGAAESHAAAAASGSTILELPVELVVAVFVMVGHTVQQDAADGRAGSL